ncbi:ArsR family transcriptional regulator [Archaeoglobus profundus]|uniref:Uncharacterized protein n=1 Tax=Archaeoglobus profundus (strain DSM 5631 / JCM 9629 / NBRC 100127 / Av18) TaxID=572546 RepID=D2RI85_ARCPA|nr:ArsR family transcriptional regulator [Archaeoglobus profundus]ADB58010.1 hypothetical protein Arcpr_0949 [Archaeoglobus profundus DSM 5631]
MDREIVGKIVEALMDGPMDWKMLKEKTKLADGTLAKYLKKMIEEGIIEEEIYMKDRRKKIYRLVPCEKTFEISIQKFIAKTFLLRIQLDFEEGKNLEVIEKRFGKGMLIFLFSGEKGVEVSKMVVDHFQEFMQSVDEEIIERYKKEFEDIWNQAKEYIVDMIKKYAGIDIHQFDPKKYRIEFDIKFMRGESAD